MADIFGFEKDMTPSSVLSFQDVVLVREGRGEISLIQNAQLDYSRTIQPIMGAGTSVVYLAPQPGTGTLRVTRAITDGGNMSADLQTDDSCKVETLDLFKVGNNGCKESGEAGVVAQGMMSGYQYSINVGSGVSVTDGATFTIVEVEAW